MKAARATTQPSFIAPSIQGLSQADSGIGQHLRRARVDMRLGLRQAARLAGTSHGTLGAYESGAKMPSAATFIRLIEAFGYSIDLLLTPRVRTRRGSPRGEELAEVLALAEQFPSKHARKREPQSRLAFPG